MKEGIVVLGYPNETLGTQPATPEERVRQTNLNNFCHSISKFISFPEVTSFKEWLEDTRNTPPRICLTINRTTIKIIGAFWEACITEAVIAALENGFSVQVNPHLSLALKEELTEKERLKLLKENLERRVGPVTLKRKKNGWVEFFLRKTHFFDKKMVYLKNK